MVPVSLWTILQLVYTFQLTLLLQNYYWAKCQPTEMAITSEGLEKKLKEELECTHVELVDESGGCGAKFSALIVSNKFEGKPLLQRHRMVNACLAEELKSIHAFSMKTLTPAKWEEQQGKS